MKKLLTMASSLILLLVLSACTGTPDQQATQSTDTADTNAFLDDQIFDEATAGSDPARCNEIENKEKRDSCVIIARSKLTTNEAVENMDTENCDKIEDDRFKKNCITSVEVAIEAENAEKLKEEEFQNLLDESADINVAAYEAKDPSLCETLEDETMIPSCKSNIISNQALEADNPALCDQIGDQDFIDLCKGGFEGAL